MDSEQLADVGHHIEMSEHHTLREASCSARVWQHNEVFLRIDADLWWVAILVEKAGERGGSLGLPNDEHLFDPSPLGRVHGSIHECRRGEEEAGPRIVELIRNVVDSKKRIDGGDDTTNRGHSVEGHD